MVIKKCIIFLFVFLVFGCDYKDETLLMPKRPYMGEQLKTNGVYCRVDSVSGFGDCFFLYRDGTFHIGSAFELGNFENSLEKMSTKEWSNIAKNTIYLWGHFIVEENKLTYECWVPPSGGGFPTYVYEGTIKNDTTIYMERYRHSRSGEWSTMNKTYRLYGIRNKPDSLNRFTN